MDTQELNTDMNKSESQSCSAEAEGEYEEASFSQQFGDILRQNSIANPYKPLHVS